MTDYQSNVDPAAAPEAPVVVTEPSVGFLSTATGKLVVGGVVLLLLIGAIGAAVVYFFIGGSPSGSVDQTVKTPTSSGQGSAAPTLEPVSPAEASLASTFTFRNIFAPTVKRTYEASATADTGSSTTDDGSTTATETPSVPSNTLFLQSIISENGEPKAVFLWNDQSYTVGENQQVDATPWKVLKIDSDSVLMLYGDSQVTLSVGQGVGK